MVWLDPSGRLNAVQTSANKLSITLKTIPPIFFIKSHFAVTHSIGITKKEVMLEVAMYPQQSKIPHLGHYLEDILSSLTEVTEDGKCLGYPVALYLELIEESFIGVN